MGSIHQVNCNMKQVYVASMQNSAKLKLQLESEESFTSKSKQNVTKRCTI